MQVDPCKLLMLTEITISKKKFREKVSPPDTN